MAKRNGPIGYTEWVEALGKPLTVENSEYLSKGDLKQSSLYAELFNRISDYVTDTFDAEAGKLKACVDIADAVYVLTRLNSVCKRLTFFRTPKFIRKCDADRLAASIKASADRLLSRFDNAVAQNVELAYAISTVRRTTEAI